VALHVESAEPTTHVVVTRLESNGRWTAPKRVTQTRELVSADGENRPKIAVVRGEEISTRRVRINRMFEEVLKRVQTPQVNPFHPSDPRVEAFLSESS
jgi:hypothetical protein